MGQVSSKVAKGVLKAVGKAAAKDKDKGAAAETAMRKRFEKAMAAQTKVENIERVGPSHPDYDKLKELRKAADAYNKGGLVTKSKTGHMDYRKGGLTLSSVDNRKKKK